MNAVDFLLGADALARHGGRTAFICGDETVSFSDLAAQAARAAGALAALGMRPGDRVLLLMRDTPEFAAAWLGALHLGAVAVALNSKLSEAEYRHILADSEARLAVVEDVFARGRADLTAELSSAGRIVVAGASLPGRPDWRALLETAAPAPLFDAATDSPAFVLYSSGTTGRPKGMVHSHGSIRHVGAALRCFGLAAGDVVFATSKFFFAYGLEHAFLAPLAMGTTSILSAEWPTAESVLEIVARHAPSALFSVPTIYRRLLAEPAGRLAPLRNVTRFVSAGEPLSARLAEQWRTATGGELLNLYGMSETFCACIVTTPGTSDGKRTGRPLDGVEARVDAERVLWVRHPAQARGYLNLPDATAQQFKDGWFCTRDLFVEDAQGYLVHQGRADDRVKIAGQWVQPSELEEAVAGLPQVAEAACVAVPDADGLERLALFVAAKGDGTLALEAAAAACERSLPRHKRPKWLRSVDQLPRTATGKVQRFKLRELLERELSGRR